MRKHLITGLSLLACDKNEVPSGFVISDTDAKTISFVEIATDMPDSTRVYEFLYMGYDEANIRYQLQYIYCDRAVTI